MTKYTKISYNGWDVAEIVEHRDGYKIKYPKGYYNDGKIFKTIDGAQRRLERHGFQAAF